MALGAVIGICGCDGDTGCPSDAGPQEDAGCGYHQQISCPSVTTWSSTLKTGTNATTITSSQIAELKSAITTEYARRQTASTTHKFNVGDGKGYNSTVEANKPYPAPSFENTNVNREIGASNITELYEDINNIKNMSWPSNVDENLDNQEIEADQHNDLRNNIKNTENDCLCNCDYCTCNCDYCTCDCDYCTCFCNNCECDCDYCTCNNLCGCDGDYGCPCNCNNDPGSGCPCVAGGSPCDCCCNGGACQY